MHPQHFGTDPTDIRIRILKIRILIPDHFSWNFGVGEGLRSLSVLVIIYYCCCCCWWWWWWWR